MILSPRQRFQVIQERGASWGSLLVLFLPIYLEVPWTAGIGVEGNPKLAYSLLFPAVVTSALIVLKTYPIHLFGRLFLAGRPDRSGGTFRQLLTVFGYTTIPSLLALVLAFSFLLFVLLSRRFGQEGIGLYSMAMAVTLG